ncbi:hypothetical protein CKO35_15015 [Ectothiorhodospira shaposhnikovii]|uniref:hypothetical protein n=1 Tax=Ectothiorhodospira shaposhnikovii TaxID=1054 RepID=UPI001908B81A|nr:hypothetical protein [Ectothiorhodospira shaposhnikovii]MBK1674579.1 hypothetical protein [Ectothiorhodospira shaposhnikovii]
MNNRHRCQILVSAFDASQALADHASRLLGQPVPVQRFDEVNEIERYDGIWACASLLHVPAAEMPSNFQALWQALKPGGVLYCSFKRGAGERDRNGRHFTDANEDQVRVWTRELPGLAGLECWLTEDRRPDREEQWLNCLLHKGTRQLITGGDDNPFLPHLCSSIHRADAIDMAVAFIKHTGLRLLLPDLQAALDREAAGRRPARIRILTSDYLDITDPQALQQGLEWNYRINYPGDKGFLETRARFQTLFSDPATVPLSDEWIDAYEARRIPPERSWEPGSTELEPPPTPTHIQAQALEAVPAPGQPSGL